MLDSYFNSFAAYLRTGQQQHLASVFPEAPGPEFAAVYRNGFLRSCVEALRASYPVVNKIVGADYFDQLAREYVEIKPPERATFIDYGDDFPEFINRCSEQHRLEYLGYPVDGRVDR